MAEVTAATEHQTYQGTKAVRELNGMEAEAVVALKPSIIDRQTGRLVLAAEAPMRSRFLRDNELMHRASLTA
jgi:hypothetical protein